MNKNVIKHEFFNYVKKYDTKNFHIKRKLDHSLRVMKICRTIANNLQFNQEEQEIAEIIGLLHDIARFEQYTKYQTFNDKKTFDHGKRGIKILQDNNYIRKYIETEKYDSIIFKAIKNHNKFQIEDNLNSEELKFAKIIRDADKIDIMYQGTVITWENQEDKIENLKITEQDILPFREKRPVDRSKDLQNVEYHMLHLLTLLGFVFDINYKISFEILKETEYINIILNKFKFKDLKTQELMDEVRQIVNKYIALK